MSDAKPTSLPDMNALAAEVCDLWQEHLAAYTEDPAAKAELMRLMEPSLRLFAGWTEKAQTAPHGAGSSPDRKTDAGRAGTHGGSGNDNTQAGNAAHGPAAAGSASDDGALRLAQLAYRVAELEKRLARIESTSTSSAAKSPRSRKPIH
jgi:hypothetical protein